ncbi:transporter [Halarcobacter mediterraneus]|uniref:Transporter n=1 Tax=Halarcobacter mediterraneus TaxID=2023153 RepID=A0A4Q1AVV2_9BACT|nr:AEC family transporter [Halarcobacter mediterraneus]RXK11540.1 transporter [Halarcobacter mediterraneus]
MQNIIEALLPVFFLILLGYFFKRIKFPNEEFWVSSDKFTYYILFPSLLIYKLSTASLDGINGFNFILSAFLTMVILTIALMLFNKFIKKFKGDSFTSIYQGSIRFNTYVFLALVDAIFGDKGLVLAALLMTFMIPLINIFCISIFSVYATNSKIDIKSFTLSIVKNPLIMGCLVGGFLNFFGISLFTPLEKTLGILSSAALPLGLLSVGVGLHLSQIKEAKLELILALLIKLIIYPFIIYLIGVYLGVQGLALAVLVVFGSMPTAPSSYILARQLGGDLKLMSAIITLEILLSIISIAVILSIITV